MPFVSDASPLIAFGRADRLAIVQAVLGRVTVPRAIFNELVLDAHGRPGAAAIERASWIIVDDMDLVPPAAIRRSLSSQDAMALALAVAQNAALLTDDLALRKEATERGIAVVGCLGVLRCAKDRGVISQAAPVLEALMAQGYRLGERLRREWLKSIGETG